MDNRDFNMETILKRVTLALGGLLLVISILFSYDGFDQNVTGGNDGYSSLAKFIGFTLAITVSVIQFVFNTDFRNLNMTLKGVGFISYAYSIWTNYLGIKHILQADEMTSWVIAVFMDVTPESLIAWSVGESLRGDFLGNLTKIFFSSGSSKKYDDQRRNNLRSPNQPADGYKRQNDPQKVQAHQVSSKHNKHKGNERRQFLETLREKKPVDGETEPRIRYFE